MFCCAVRSWILALAIVVPAVLTAGSVRAAEAISEQTLARYEAAVTAIDAGDSAGAEPVLREIVGKHPNPDLTRGYRPYFELARACLLLGELEEAELSLAISEGLMPRKARREVRRSVERLRVELERAGG